MSAIQFQPPSQIKLILKCYANCDDVQLCWRTVDNDMKDTAVEKSLGFMIERQRKVNGKWSASEILRNRVGFGNETIDPDNPEDISRPSSIWPFQRYDWTDHGATNNESIRYRISAMGEKSNTVLGRDELKMLMTSPWTPEIKITADAGDGIQVYFNRGTIMSQYVARIARKNNWTKEQVKQNLKNLEEPLRIFLSGELRLSIINLLDQVAANPFLTLYGALFELSDAELISKLKRIGPRANIILSDGANSKGKNPVVYYDENKDAREELRNAGVTVFDRILGKQGLGHNKLLIVYDTKKKEAQTVLSGSTNWTTTGLCTQLNNAIIISDPKIADIYMDYWTKLKESGNGFNSSLMDFNIRSPHIYKNAELTFTRALKTPKPNLPPDLKYIKELIDGAQSSIQYIMFQPGDEPLLSILAKRQNPDIYIRGVVSTVIESNKEKFSLLDDSMQMKDYKTDLIQPDGIQHDFSYWVGEITRGGFIPSIGYAITHTKMIVIDAFGENPIIITGSYNFSASASQKNDENFIVIKGNRKLAEHYAVACMSIYAHYRYRAYLLTKKPSGSIWTHLDADPVWQESRLTSERTLKHLKFWCR